MRRMLPAVLLIACACAQKSAAQIVSGAPSAAASRGSAKLSLQSVVRITGQGQTFSTTTRGDGVSELGGARLGRITLTVTTSPAAGRALQPCEMVSQGTVVYVKVPPQAGKSWVSVDIAKFAGVDPNALSSDPTSQLDYLKNVSGGVTTLGHDDIRGVPAKHYRYTLTTDQLMTKIAPERRAPIRSALGQLGISSFPVDAWIDAQGLPRRVSFDWKTSRQGATLDISTLVDMYDYGTKVDVVAPASGQVRQTSEPTASFAECFGAPAGSLGGVPQG